jgi:hypothetical protein
VKSLCVRPHTLLACLPLALIPPSHSLLHVAAPYSALSPLSSKASLPGQPKVELARSPTSATSAPASHPQPQSQPPIYSRRLSNQMSSHSHSHSQPVNLSSTSPLRPFALRPPSPRHMTCCSSSAVSANRALPLHRIVPWCLTPCIREPPGCTIPLANLRRRRPRTTCSLSAQSRTKAPLAHSLPNCNSAL